MGARINLINQRFGRLLVISETKERDSGGSIIWKCQCDCGNIAYVSSNGLRRKTRPTRSCGCLNKEVAATIGRNNLNDLTGQVFGQLTVISRVNNLTKTNHNKTMWLCKCQCGTETIVCSQSLVSGNTQSCGCIKSRGEAKIANILNANKILYEKEKTFIDGISPRGGHYRFDFFINNQYVIEYDGKQHFEDSSWGSELSSKEYAQQIDTEKNEYCKLHNIPIIRIPYTHLQDLKLSDLLLETSHFIIK